MYCVEKVDIIYLFLEVWLCEGGWGGVGVGGYLVLVDNSWREHERISNE